MGNAPADLPGCARDNDDFAGECCGHDGSYAMKVESFEAACRIGRKAFDGLRDADAATWITDCPLAAIQIEQNAGTKPLHPMSLLARAYRGDDFPGETRR